MHCGSTTSDQFLRDNLDWLSRATNWAKFTATASLGHHVYQKILQIVHHFPMAVVYMHLVSYMQIMVVKLSNVYLINL
jgi:hypothetical protein